MRHLLILSFAVAVLSACSKPEAMTIEEQILTKAFTGFVAAETYDRVCGGSKLSNTDPKSNPDFVLYFGNRQLFGARLGTLWKLRHPDGTVEQGVAALVDTEKRIDAQIETSLKEKGCDSEAGTQGKKMYELYTKTHPAIISGFMDKSIEKEGGKITPPETVK